MAILCSVGRFECKSKAISVVVGLRNMSISRLGGFPLTIRSRKLIHPLLSYAELNFMSVCIWFLYLLTRLGLCSFGVVCD